MRPEEATPTGAVLHPGFPAVRTSRHTAPVSTPAPLRAEPEVRGITTPVAIRPPKALGRRSRNEGQDARRLEVRGRRPRSSLLVPFRFSFPTVGHVDDTVFRSGGVQDETSFPAGGTPSIRTCTDFGKDLLTYPSLLRSANATCGYRPHFESFAMVFVPRASRIPPPSGWTILRPRWARGL